MRIPPGVEASERAKGNQRAMLERVVSGGQTGADQGGWRAARVAGIATGGGCRIDS